MTWLSSEADARAPEHRYPDRVTQGESAMAITMLEVAVDRA